MKKQLIVVITVASLSLSGCANLSKGQQTAIGAGTGGAIGAAVGAIFGGGKGAAIGAAGGAVLGGVLTYALATDPYTESVTQQTDDWKEDVGGKPELVKTSHVVEKGEDRERIDVQKITMSENQMISNNHLSPKVKKHLQSASNKSKGAEGGNVLVICPQNTSPTIVQEIKETGVNVEQDESLIGYVVVFSRDNVKKTEILI